MKTNYLVEPEKEIYTRNEISIPAKVENSSPHITVKCRRSITEIDEKLWDSLLSGSNVFHSHTFLKCIEDARVENSKFWYLLFFVGEKPVGSAVLSLFAVSLDLLSGKLIAQLCKFIRKFFPGFMKIKILFCGTPVSAGKNNLVICTESLKNKIIDLLVNQMKTIAKENKVIMLCLKEICAQECEWLNPDADYNFIRARSIPFVKLYLRKEWNTFSDYLKAMRYNYRRQIKHSLRKLSIKEIDSQFSPSNPGKDIPQLIVKRPGKNDASAFHKLYLEVMEKAENKLEILNLEFFENVFFNIKDICYLVSLVDKEKELGSALVMHLNHTMVFFLIGLDYDQNRKYDTYFNLIYRIISLAIEKKCSMLELGQTSYYFKQRCGGSCEEMFFYIKSLNKPLHFLLSFFQPLLFPRTEVNKLHVFH